jgi:uncharacterized membrane protein
MGIELTETKVRYNFPWVYSPLKFFIVLNLISISIAYIINEFVVTEEVFYKSYAERYTEEKILELTHTISKVKWILYAISPLVYLIRFSIVASILSIGDFVMETKIGFRTLFKVAMFAEIIFLLPDIAKIIWFLLFEQAETIRQVGSFEILSILSLFKDEEIYTWLKYPFSIANIFELVYWLLLAACIKYHTNFSFNKSLAFVLKTYVPVLFLWCVFVVFLSLSLN